MKLQKEVIGLFITIFTLSTATAHATGWALPVNNFGLPEDFMGSISKITNWLVGFTAALTVLAIIYGGVVYVEASGDQERITMAKKSIKYAVMGLAMAGIAYAIVNLVITKVLVEGAATPAA